MLLDPGHGVMEVLNLLTRVDLLVPEEKPKKSADMRTLKGCGVSRRRRTTNSSKNT